MNFISNDSLIDTKDLILFIKVELIIYKINNFNF